MLSECVHTYTIPWCNNKPEAKRADVPKMVVMIVHMICRLQSIAVKHFMIGVKYQEFVATDVSDLDQFRAKQIGALAHPFFKTKYCNKTKIVKILWAHCLGRSTSNVPMKLQCLECKYVQLYCFARQHHIVPHIFLFRDLLWVWVQFYNANLNYDKSQKRPWYT